VPNDDMSCKYQIDCFMLYYILYGHLATPRQTGQKEMGEAKGFYVVELTDILRTDVEEDICT
jgi:hypothetical protein